MGCIHWLCAMDSISDQYMYNFDCWLCALYMYNSLYGTDHHKYVPSVGVGVSSIIMNIIMVRQLYN